MCIRLSEAIAEDENKIHLVKENAATTNNALLLVGGIISFE